jgi:hypothetical protein
LAFLTQNKGKLCKKISIIYVIEKNAIFFAENWRKSHKIVIITSNPGAYAMILKIFQPILPIVSYSASVVKIYSVMSSLVRFGNKNISFQFEKTV